MLRVSEARVATTKQQQRCWLRNGGNAQTAQVPVQTVETAVAQVLQQGLYGVKQLGVGRGWSTEFQSLTFILINDTRVVSRFQLS